MENACTVYIMAMSWPELYLLFDTHVHTHTWRKADCEQSCWGTSMKSWMKSSYSMAGCYLETGGGMSSKVCWYKVACMRNADWFPLQNSRAWRSYKALVHFLLLGTATVFRLTLKSTRMHFDFSSLISLHSLLLVGISCVTWHGNRRKNLTFFKDWWMGKPHCLQLNVVGKG